MSHDIFKVGDLEAVIGDNAAHGKHRAGYNGVWSLKHKKSTRNLFVPSYTGLNLEHVFNGETEFISNDHFFEPRRSPMTFKKLNDQSCELHQPPTPHFHVESRTRFTLKPPWYIDIDFECIPHQHVHPNGYIGLFWASYMNAPADKSIHFQGGWKKGQKMWMQHCTQKHDDESSVLHFDDTTKLSFKPGNRNALFMNYSPMRFVTPFYYGYFEDLVYIIMFDRFEGIRFTHSPSGGGFNQTFHTTHPAWDYQFIIPEYEVSKKYGFKARAVFRPRCSRKEILDEYQMWAG